MIEKALELFAGQVRAGEATSAELLASAQDFFGKEAPEGSPGEVLMAARRHLEWFVLERHSPTLFGTPVERMLDAWRQGGGSDLEQALPALLDSFTGIFEVGEVKAGEGAWLRDVAGFGSYALLEPDGSHGMQDGDVLVGRLFPVGDGLHRVSAAAGFFRDQKLLSAIEADLQAARESSGQNVLHLSQLELEQMFWASGRAPEQADPSTEALGVLLDGGVAQSRAQRILAFLRASPFDPERLTPGAGDPLGEILDELAFDTTVDLDAARRTLTRVWAETRPEGVERSDPDQPRSTREAVDAFARGREAGGDLESLLRELEKDLELDGPSAVEEEEETPAPDFPGVVGALVTEFLWETGRQDSALEERYQCLGALSQYGERIGLAEGLDESELLRFTTFWLHERALLTDGDAARELLDALEAFCAWLETAHEIELSAAFTPTLQHLRESLPRIVEINNLMQPTAPDSDTGELYEVRGDSRGRYAGVRDRAGNESDVLPADRTLVDRLRPGDRLRARMTDGGLAVYRCYPPEAARLLGPG